MNKGSFTKFYFVLFLFCDNVWVLFSSSNVTQSKLFHVVDSEAINSVSSFSSLLQEGPPSCFTVILITMPFCFCVSLCFRCNQLNRLHPSEVHLLFLAPSCCPIHQCLQEELLSSPQSLTVQSWHQVRQDKIVRTFEPSSKRDMWVQSCWLMFMNFGQRSLLQHCYCSSPVC